ncbi:MAG: HPr family phosphocarrier protein [Ruminococcus sp.]|jgi:phosphocarrier protein|nr:HPr family phosphocarrier protein [Ruminococcus sp.]MBQ1309791.1 HPr family phosphocarrier protein [Ruminococcus sp.]MBQ1602057.1 HPr family phosphocarrier protein [Ruminococcus sp.]MBQ1638220.1 HPr family phosphocarrier protein [Ruminococcus sp.]MBQ1686084.1 HPr family phosphocarrier protein [Ruminococcus sp.]
MVSKKVTLVNAQGFHMRPASVFATAMGKYASSVTIKFNGNDYNAKSLLNIIAACIKCGSEIELVCDGPDENEALADAVERIESGLGE